MGGIRCEKGAREIGKEERERERERREGEIILSVEHGIATEWCREEMKMEKGGKYKVVFLADLICCLWLMKLFLVM